MAKRKKRQSPKWRFNFADNFSLDPETKHSIRVIFLLVAAAILILSLFSLAGPVGEKLRLGLIVLFGKAYFIYPFVLFGWGLLLAAKNKISISPANYLGAVVLFLALQGLLHARPEPWPLSWEFFKQGLGGGYVGWFVSTPLLKVLGFWAAIILLIALLLTGIFLTFNTSLQALFSWLSYPAYIKNKILEWKERRSLDQPADDYDSYAGETEEAEDEPEEDLEVEHEVEEESEVDFSSQDLTDDTKQLDMGIKTKRRTKIDIPLHLLDGSRSKPTSGDVMANKEKIRKTLQNFGIEVEMGEVSVGPTVTQYTLRPAEGVKLSAITALQNDLALALAAHPIRIEAPIPGKALVGIEVPNQSIATVALKDIIGSREFAQRKSNLTIGLGKDVAGKVWLADLATMPHLLIAGATGSGKSVCINTLILSLLYQNSPDDLKFILVDPKRVELSLYDSLPYLLTPVITDAQKTINALKWLLAEMDSRYQKLSSISQRNIVGYNKVSEEKMPYIVLIIDELADLMSVAAAEVEGAIIRLAQMARAVGIHLVLATQRPSVDVITGLIKANITSRIAFAVASQTDSRTILDAAGAEKLLGRGDMLYTSAQLSKPKRLQGAFVSEAEIQRVVAYIKKVGGEVDYNEEVTAKTTSAVNAVDGQGDDPLLEEAERLVIQAGKASASYLQRRLRVGYARAARLIDLLEAKGIVGPADGAKPREVLVSPEELTEETEEDNNNHYDE